MKKMKNIFTDDLAKWEVWLYYVTLPLGFIIAALIGGSIKPF